VKALVSSFRIKFTKHAVEKFEILRRYGLEVSKDQVRDTISKPKRVEQRGDQYLAIKPLNTRHALHVVYEKRKNYLVVIKFYPVRRERYDI